MEARNEMSLDKQTLLPCPFCGSPAEIRKRKTTLVGCTKCGAYCFQQLRDEGSAIRAWNTRPIPTTRTQEMVSVLKAVRSFMIPGMNWTGDIGENLKFEMDKVIAKLEASQPAKGYDEIMDEIADGLLPKPQQSDEGLREAVEVLKGEQKWIEIGERAVKSPAFLQGSPELYSRLAMAYFSMVCAGRIVNAALAQPASGGGA